MVDSVRRWLTSIVGVCILVSCASPTVRLQDSRPVPANRITAPALAALNGNLVVVRDRRPGAFVTNDVILYIDGRAVATLQEAESIRLQVDAGKHVLGVKLAFDPLGIRPIVEVAVDVPPSPTMFRIIGGGDGENAQIQRSAM